MTLNVRGQMEYPCSNDQGVIDLKARRLTQTSRKQSQDDGDGRQGKTDVMRNQDRTRLIVADVRILILSIAGVRNQRGRHFVLASASIIARAGSNTKGVESWPPYTKRQESRKGLHILTQGLGSVVLRVEGGMVTPHAYEAVNLYPIVAFADLLRATSSSMISGIETKL